MNQRRAFSREFKLAAVKKASEQGLSIAEVARQLGIRDAYIPMRKGSLYLVAVMDWFRRYAISLRLSNSMDVDF